MIAALRALLVNPSVCAQDRIKAALSLQHFGEQYDVMNISAKLPTIFKQTMRFLSRQVLF